MMHAAGGGRFDEVATDGSVDQGADLAFVDAGLANGLVGRLDALFAGTHPRRPETPLANARHQFQPPLGQAKPPVERRKSGLDLVRRDDLVGQRIGQRFNTNVLVSHRATDKGAGIAEIFVGVDSRRRFLSQFRLIGDGSRLLQNTHDSRVPDTRYPGCRRA